MKLMIKYEHLEKKKKMKIEGLVLKMNKFMGLD